MKNALQTANPLSQNHQTNLRAPGGRINDGNPTRRAHDSTHNDRDQTPHAVFGRWGVAGLPDLPNREKRSDQSQRLGKAAQHHTVGSGTAR